MMKSLIKDELESNLILSHSQVNLSLIVHYISCPLYEAVFSFTYSHENIVGFFGNK